MIELEYDAKSETYDAYARGVYGFGETRREALIELRGLLENLIIECSEKLAKLEEK